MAIKINSLSKSYKGVAAVKDFSLTIEQGMFGLLGPNGAGKTTLMRMLATLLSPTRGTAEIYGLDILSKKQEIRSFLGYLPQDFGLYKRLTPLEFLDFVAQLKGITEKRQRSTAVEDVLHKVNMWEARNRKMGGFSGGMRRRVGIAQALLGDPRLLIVDEPTAGLDPEERVRFRNMLAEISGGRVVLLSTHIVGDIESTCNKLAVMQQGCLRFSGNQDKLIKLAEDRVWQVEAEERELPALKQRGHVISTRLKGKTSLVRILAEVKPTESAIPVAPGLEEGYMALTAGGSRAYEETTL